MHGRKQSLQVMLDVDIVRRAKCMTDRVLSRAYP